MPTYKLPDEVIATHKALLDAHDWRRSPELRLASLIPQGGFEPRDILALVVIEAAVRKIDSLRHNYSTTAYSREDPANTITSWRPMPSCPIHRN